MTADEQKFWDRAACAALGAYLHQPELIGKAARSIGLEPVPFQAAAAAQNADALLAERRKREFDNAQAEVSWSPEVKALVKAARAQCSGRCPGYLELGQALKPFEGMEEEE